MQRRLLPSRIIAYVKASESLLAQAQDMESESQRIADDVEIYTEIVQRLTNLVFTLGSRGYGPTDSCIVEITACVQRVTDMAQILTRKALSCTERAKEFRELHVVTRNEALRLKALNEPHMDL